MNTPKHPANMTLAEFKALPQLPTSPTKTGYRVLYHVVRDPRDVDMLLHDGIDPRKAHSGVHGADQPDSFWTTDTPTGYDSNGTVLAVQVPEEYAETAGVGQFIVRRRIPAEDIIGIDPIAPSNPSVVPQRLSHIAHNEYADSYWQAYQDEKARPMAVNTQLVEIYQAMAPAMRQMFRSAMAAAIGDEERHALDRIDAGTQPAIKVGSLTSAQRSRLDVRADLTGDELAFGRSSDDDDDVAKSGLRRDRAGTHQEWRQKEEFTRGGHVRYESPLAQHYAELMEDQQDQESLNRALNEARLAEKRGEITSGDLSALRNLHDYHNVNLEGQKRERSRRDRDVEDQERERLRREALAHARHSVYETPAAQHYAELMEDQLRQDASNNTLLDLGRVLGRARLAAARQEVTPGDLSSLEALHTQAYRVILDRVRDSELQERQRNRMQQSRLDVRAESLPIYSGLAPQITWSSPPLSPHRKLIDAATEELQSLDRPNANTAKKVLRNLVKSGIDREVVESVEGSLEDFVSTVRSDFDSAEEYQDARQEAWDTFVSELEQVDLDDEEGGHDPYPEAPRPFVSGLAGGIVVDPSLARSTPCIQIELGDRRLVYSRGIIGALSDENEAAYCAEGVIPHVVTEAQLTRIRSLTEAAPKCATDTNDVDTFLSCIGRELRAAQA